MLRYYIFINTTLITNPMNANKYVNIADLNHKETDLLTFFPDLKNNTLHTIPERMHHPIKINTIIITTVTIPLIIVSHQPLLL